MKVPARKSVLLLALGALLVILGGAGCATTESENLSARPWNAPSGFETGMPGMPSSLYDQRR